MDTKIVTLTTTTATATTDNKAILTVAPRVFHLARTASGIACILFEFIRSRRLFEAAGYKSMPQYAKAHLGVEGTNYKKTARAGTTAWTLMPELCARVVDGLHEGGVDASNPPPEVPNYSILANLKRVINRLPESEQTNLLVRIRANEMTVAELEEVGRYDRFTRTTSKTARHDSQALDLADSSQAHETSSYGESLALVPVGAVPPGVQATTAPPASAPPANVIEKPVRRPVREWPLELQYEALARFVRWHDTATLKQADRDRCLAALRLLADAVLEATGRFERLVEED